MAGYVGRDAVIVGAVRSPIGNRVESRVAWCGLTHSLT